MQQNTTGHFEIFPANSKGSSWRADITGLRALAVLPVLFFHAFPGLLPGGFFGVDIFFVISGYLISGIIFRGLIRGNFSYCNFYAKRIKRILPNLITLLTVVVVPGWFLLSADEMVALGKSIYSSSAFYQNFRLISDTGYFDLASAQKPLLHLWSLAIEEQFYIVFPIIAVIVWKCSAKSTAAIGVLVALVTAGSFAACLLTPDLTLRFYFPLTRFWELGAGICLAYAEAFHIQSSAFYSLRLRNALSVTGLAMVAAAVLLYRPGIPAPGAFSLLSVLGAVFLIAANKDAVVNRAFLSLKGMVFVGLISYSLYLWHWPLIAYIHITFSHPDTLYFLAALALTFPIAWFGYTFIEDPIRRSKNNRFWVIVLLAGLVGTFCLGKAIKKMDGFPERPIAQALFSTGDFNFGELVDHWDFDGTDIQSFKKGAAPEILYAGDSHIEQYAARAKVLEERSGKASVYLTDGSCFMSNGFTNTDGKPERCQEESKTLERLIGNGRIKTVVISQFWGAYQRLDENKFEDGLSRYAALMKKYAGKKKFYVVLDPPCDDGSYDLKSKLTSRLDVEKFAASRFIVGLPKNDMWEKGNARARAELSPYAEIIAPADLVCPNKKCDLRRYKDDDHLTSTYVKENAFWIDQIYDFSDKNDAKNLK